MQPNATSSGTGVAAPRAKRLPELDAAKGIAIVLVVIFHVWPSMIASNRMSNSALHDWLDAFVYTFHVPVFFFISGVAMADPRRPGFFADVCRRLVYPYVIWSLFQGFVIASVGGAAHFPMPPAEVIPSILLDPRHQLWFLHTLIVATLIIGIAVRSGISRRNILIGSILLFAVTLIVYHPLAIRSVEKYTIYLAAGFWLGRPKSFPPAWTAVPAFGAVALAVSLNWHTIDLVRPGLAALGIIGTLAIAAAWPAKPLCELGRASLAVFLGHVLAAAPARVLPLPLLSGTALGIALPYALWRFAEAWSLPIFRWPARTVAAPGEPALPQPDASSSLPRAF